MATLTTNLSVEALRERYVSSSNVRESRHFQTIWLLAKGHSVGEVVEMTSLGRRWIEQLVARYNAEGPESYHTNCFDSVIPDLAWRATSRFVFQAIYSQLYKTLPPDAHGLSCCLNGPRNLAIILS